MIKNVPYMLQHGKISMLRGMRDAELVGRVSSGSTKYRQEIKRGEEL